MKNKLLNTLTETEYKYVALAAHGLSPEEISIKVFRSIETIKTTLRNAREKLGLKKATELVASYWCNIIGEDLEERRRKILSAALLFIMILCHFEHDAARGRRNRGLTTRRPRIEFTTPITA